MEDTQLALTTSISLCLRLPCLLNRCIYFLISYNCSSNGGCHLVKHPRKPACMQENILNDRLPTPLQQRGVNCRIARWKWPVIIKEVLGDKNIQHIPTLQCIKYYLNLNIKCFCYSKIPSLVLLLKIYKIQSYVIHIKLYWSKIDMKYNNKEQFDGINFLTKWVAYYKPSNTQSGNDCCVDFHSWHTTGAACDNSFSWITSPILHWNSK